MSRLRTGNSSKQGKVFGMECAPKVQVAPVFGVEYTSKALPAEQTLERNKSWPVEASESKEKRKSCIQSAADGLSPLLAGLPGEYKKETVIGACPLFDAEVYTHKNHTWNPPTETNQLPRLINEDNGKEMAVLQTWAGGEKHYSWISSGLHLDLNLPASSHPASGSVVQILSLVAKKPACLIVVYHTKAEATSARSAERNATVQLARLLKTALLKVCHFDFMILPCTLEYSTFDEKTLEAEVGERLKFSRTYYTGPAELDADTVTGLWKAVTTISGVSYVPFFLCPDRSLKGNLVLMEAGWRTLLFLLLDKLANHGASAGEAERHICYTPETEFKVKSAVMEAAQRLSFCDEVAIISVDEKIRDCSERLVELMKEEYSVDLKLSVESSEKPVQESIQSKKGPKPKYIICIDYPQEVTIREVVVLYVGISKTLKTCLSAN